MSRFRDVALLLLVLALVTGLASAQTGPGVSVSTVANGQVTQTNYSPTPPAKIPAGANGLYKYWDGLASTDYYNVPPYVAAPPNPQIAVGPDDILTIVNRTIARYPNPNAPGTSATGGVTNPFLNPPTEKAWLDVWMGLTVLGGISSTTALCPSGTGSNSVCVIDNPSIRYDQLQGRFVVLFTVTDLPAHRSNFVLVVSKSSLVRGCTNTTPTPPTCVASSPFFTPPVIAPIVGGTSTGGVNSTNWVLYSIPINLTYVTAPTTLGTGIAGKPITVTTGGSSINNFVNAGFCANGGPLPINSVTQRLCTNYFPTAARMGFDNDNIILTAPVLDQMGATAEGTLATAAGQTMGPYAGTRVVSVAKLVVYNGTGLGTNQPDVCLGNSPIDCVATNLADNTATGTLTTLSAAACRIAAPAVGACAATTQANPIPKIFWEPDNLRGRALASFDAQVAPSGTPQAGVLTPIDYLVGNPITDALTIGYAGVPASASNIYLQPIVFSCPASAIFSAVSSVQFCGMPGAGQVADMPLLGTIRTLSGIAGIDDPAPVGQGFSAAAMTTNPLNTPVSPTTNTRLFVGDARPQQVMFREGLLYIARNVRLGSWFHNYYVGTSTVMYDILKTCATGAPTAACGGYSITGANLGNPAMIFETEWFNGQNVPDPSGNINGFGFYQPMFDVPADVIQSGPASPINVLPWLEKIFVGMTTGGTANVAPTFAKNFPSLWDFRPGDDAYDTVLPYLNPYTGVVFTTVPCADNVTVQVLSKSGSTITVADPSGLGVGMYLTGTGSTTQITAIAGNVVTLSSAFSGSTFPTNATFSRNPQNQNAIITQITAGSPVVAVASLTGLQIGATISSSSVDKTAKFVAGLTINVGTSTGSIGIGQTITPKSDSYTLTTTAGSVVLSGLSATAKVSVGENVTGTGIGAASHVAAVDFVAGTVTLDVAATASGTNSITFDPTPLLGAGATAVASNPTVTGDITISNATLLPTGVNGASLTFTTPALFPAGTTILNIQTIGGVNFLTMSQPALGTIPAGIMNVPVSFSVTAANQPTCPMIPFSSRGGASTDPNDGSLWLYGEFAKNRLSTIPGPGVWGTAVANYALDFPALDPYNNDNAYFADVPTSSPYFTWIQIAKNAGLNYGTAGATCTGGILQPPVSGTTPVSPGNSVACSNFFPDSAITRSEMAKWIVLAQMDEQQIDAYLRATGGIPVGNPTAVTFADTISDVNLRYIEVMARRGYTKGCSATLDAKYNYCPTLQVTRGQMAVFEVRAKMNNVFPTTLSGIPLSAPYGDNFGLFTQTAYFTDVPSTHDFFIYIQKLRELRVSNGTSATTFSPDANITRKEIAVFIVRAFFL